LLEGEGQVRLIFFLPDELVDVVRPDG